MEGTSTNPVTTPAPATPDAPVKTPGKIVSAGKPIAAVLPQNQPVPDPNTPASAAGAANTTDPETGSGGSGPASQAQGDTNPPAGDSPKLPDVTDEQLKEILAKKGIDGFDGGLDKLKELLAKANAPAPVELTEEQKAAQQQELENKMLALHLANGGKPEEFVAYKTVMNANLKDLSNEELKRELRNEGFTDSEISSIVKERYYQLDPAELEKGDDESDEDFQKRVDALKKKVAFGSKKLENRSLHIVQQAKGYYEQLKQAVESEELLAKKESEFQSKVDEFAKTLPRKMTFTLGKIDNDQEIPPVDFDVTEDQVAAVVATIKDPGKRQNFLYNQDGSFNLENIAQILLKNEILESAIKAAYLESGKRTVEDFEKRFPAAGAGDVGVGGVRQGATGGRKGHIVKAGTPQVAVRQQ